MKRLLLACLLLALPWTASAAVRGEPVEYRAGDTVMKGYLAYDDGLKGPRPAVLVVHEWWGHNDYARRRARQLAGMGYTALAVDMFGDGRTAGHPDEAGAFAGAVRKNLELGKARFTAAMNVLERHATVDKTRIAAIGYCFGGATVLEMARQGLDLKGVASFHGALTTDAPARPGAVKPRVLVLTGGADRMIPPEQVEGFKKEMSAAGADARVVVYPQALHSFTNPVADGYAKRFNLPVGYDAPADRASWAELDAFLKAVFTAPNGQR